MRKGWTQTRWVIVAVSASAARDETARALPGGGVEAPRGTHRVILTKS